METISIIAIAIGSVLFITLLFMFALYRRRRLNVIDDGNDNFVSEAPVDGYGDGHGYGKIYIFSEYK